MLGNDKDFLPPASPTSWTRGPSLTVQTACSTRWSRSTWPARACSPASATWRWPAACRSRCRSGRLPLPGGRHPLARRPLPRRSTPGRGTVVGERRRRGRAQAARRRARRRRHHPRRHPRLGDQQRRRAEGRLHRAERRRAGRGDRRRRRRWPASTRETIALRRGARHRHRARRPDRGRGADPGVPRARPTRRRFCALGSVKTQHRPPRRRRRRRRADQDGAGAASTARSRRACTSARRTRRSTSPAARSSCNDRAAPSWPSEGDAAPRRRQLVRHRRHQRARRRWRRRRRARGVRAARAVAAAGAVGAHAERRSSAATANLAAHLERASRARPGRRRLHAAGRPARVRRTAGVVVPRRADAAAALSQRASPARSLTGARPTRRPAGRVPVPRPGRQYVGMARGLYATEPRLPRRRSTAAPSCCCRDLGLDLRDAAATPRRATEEAAERLQQTALRPSRRCSSVEYALARLWMSWGVQPGGDARPQHRRVRGRVPGRRASRLEDALALVARAAG